MQKRYTKILHAKLIRELALLRKGPGLAPAKISKMPALETIASHIANTPASSLTNHQIYNILITEIAHSPQDIYLDAITNALGIKSSVPSLLRRRRELAEQLNKHPDTIERYENQGLANLASRLIERGHANNNSEFSSPQIRTYHLQKLENYTETTRAIATLSLGSHLSVGEHAPSLLAYLQQTQRPYLDALVSINLSSSYRGHDWYKFRLKHTFRGIRETFRIAVVLDNEDGEHLMASGLIDDFHKLIHPDDLRQDIKTIIANSKFLLRNPENNTQKLLRFEELDASAAQRVFQSAATHFARPCRLLEVTIPLEWQTPEIIYEHQSTLHIKSDVQYAYWYSPGMMQLRKLTFDFSEFPDADKRHFFVQTFLGQVSGTFHQDKNLFTLDRTTWVMPGHGLALIWQ